MSLQFHLKAGTCCNGSQGFAAKDLWDLEGCKDLFGFGMWHGPGTFFLQHMHESKYTNAGTIFKCHLWIPSQVVFVNKTPSTWFWVYFVILQTAFFWAKLYLWIESINSGWRCQMLPFANFLKIKTKSAYIDGVAKGWLRWSLQRFHILNWQLINFRAWPTLLKNQQESPNLANLLLVT